MPQDNDPKLDLHEIQGDVLIGLQKNFENFIFFKIVKVPAFKAAMMQHVIGQITTVQQVRERDFKNQEGQRHGEQWLGLNVSFTKDGLTKLLGPKRARLDAPFENGADNPATWLTLNDPPPSTWLSTFRSDTIDGVFFVTGPDEPFVTNHSKALLGDLSDSLGVVHQEMGNVRPNPMRGHEHFGFLDLISQPGIRGLTKRSNTKEPNEGHPGQDLIWPGEFVFGYSGQDPYDPVAQGTPPAVPASWVRNGSLMVFRRLEQKVPEFNAFVGEQAGKLGIDPELFASRMVGRWKSGAPTLLAPLHDHSALGKDPELNNNFQYSSDQLQLACPYAAHVRKTNPRDDPDRNKAEVQTHRIIRAGIPFGPEVGEDEVTVTVQSRGLMFVCYQTSIWKQFEFLQNKANDVAFVGGKTRPSARGKEVVKPGFDPIIGQAPGEGSRPIEVVSVGKTPYTFDMPNSWVVLTAAAYFFVPSITGLGTLLTSSALGWPQ
jgi:Dyp-type peroxidase family